MYLGGFDSEIVAFVCCLAFFWRFRDQIIYEQRLLIENRPFILIALLWTDARVVSS
jgi:hypothetical protein